MANNNHDPLNAFRQRLDVRLLSQPFTPAVSVDEQLAYGKSAAQLYMELENGISVLSDMQARKSYIWNGALAEQLGLQPGHIQINTIWEEDLLSRVHPDDLQRKYRLEFAFFRLLLTLTSEERQYYMVITKLRTKDQQGQYLILKHRLLYIGSSPDGNIRLALCLYEKVYEPAAAEFTTGIIINTKTGRPVHTTGAVQEPLLSNREQEVLRLIRLGHTSKHIAAQLNLSLHTVNRHRQNIFDKLNVSNAMEACRIAEAARLI